MKGGRVQPGRRREERKRKTRNRGRKYTKEIDGVGKVHSLEKKNGGKRVHVKMQVKKTAERDRGGKRSGIVDGL